MRTLKLISFVAASVFTLDIQASLAAEPVFETPQVALAADTADLLSRVENSLLQYAKNCETNHHTASSPTMTDTAVIEYATLHPGRVLSVDAAVAQHCWEGATQLKHAANLHVWIFPTGYPNTVFVQYEIAERADPAMESAHQLAIIEMDGYRIARIRDLTTDTTSACGHGNSLPLSKRVMSVDEQ